MLYFLQINTLSAVYKATLSLIEINTDMLNVTEG